MTLHGGAPRSALCSAQSAGTPVCVRPRGSGTPAACERRRGGLAAGRARRRPDCAALLWLCRVPSGQGGEQGSRPPCPGAEDAAAAEPGRRSSLLRLRRLARRCQATLLCFLCATPLALPLGCAERLPGPVPVIRPRGLGTRSRSHRSLSGLVWFLELEGTPRAQWPARAPQCAARPSARERPAGRMDAGFG